MPGDQEVPAEWRVGDSIPVDDPAPQRQVIAKEPKPGFFQSWLGPLLVSYLIFGLIWPFALVFTGLHVLAQGRRSLWAALLALVLSPFCLVTAVSFARGAGEFLRGGAMLHDRLRSCKDLKLLDPATRCYGRAACVRESRVAPFSEAPSDAAVRLLVWLRGPMAGNHQGWYPSRGEALQALRGPEARGLRWRGSFEDFETALGRGIGWSERLPVSQSALFQMKFLWLAPELRELDGPVIDPRWSLAVVERGGAVVFGNEDLIILMSRETGEQFAFYRSEF